MEPRKDPLSLEQNAVEPRQPTFKKRFRIEKLEERVTPAVGKSSKGTGGGGGGSSASSGWSLSGPSSVF